jgi:hypothetical protein
MNADSPWGEVRWQERHSSPPSAGSTMATSTLLPTARALATDNREDNRTLGSQHNLQIDRQIHAPQAQIQYPTPQRMMNRFRAHSDAHNSLDSVSNMSRRPYASGTASPQPKLEISRPGSISERLDWQFNSSRRASELPLGLETLGSTGMYSGTSNRSGNRYHGLTTGWSYVFILTPSARQTYQASEHQTECRLQISQHYFLPFHRCKDLPILTTAQRQYRNLLRSQPAQGVVAA